MIRRSAIFSLALSTAFAALPLRAQVGGAGSVVNGRVVVQVFVTLSDDATPYHPISGLPLGFIRTPRDTSMAVTDRSGSAIVLLPPGRYRVVSLVPTHWKGVRYAWNTPIEVKEDMGQVNLRRTDAIAAKVVATTVTSTSNGETVERTVERKEVVRAAAPVAVAPVAPVASQAPAPTPAVAPAPAPVAISVSEAMAERADPAPAAPVKVVDARPAKVADARAAMPRPALGSSRTKGLFIGLDAEGNGLQTNIAGSSVESGAGAGVVLGYGFTRRLSLYADVSDAQMNATAGGTYMLGNADFGARVHFRSGHVIVPFIELGATARQVSTTQSGVTYTANGIGGSAGLGFNIYFMRAVALSTAADWSMGNINNYQVDNLVGGSSVSAMTARVHVGLVWFP